MNTILPNEVNSLLRSGLANGNPNDQAQLARLTRLSAAQFHANRFWDRLQTPRTPEQLVEMRQTAVTAWQDAKRQMPPAVGINMQVDTKFNNLKALYAAEYLSAMHRAVVAEASVVHTDTSHLYDGARHDFRVRLGTIFSTASLKVPGDYLEKLADMALNNEQAVYPPMDRALNLKALIKTIEADHPQMAAAKLADHPHLIADHAALCDASYHYRGTSNTNALTSAIRSVLAPGSHASAADGEIEQQAEAMVGRVVAMARLGYAEPAIFAETVKQLPPSFKKWLDVSQQLEENPSLKPTPTHPEPKNAQDDNAPFFPATLRCYVEHETGVRVPTSREAQEAYESRHVQPQERPDPTDPKYAGTKWAGDETTRRQLSTLAAFNRGGS